VATLDVTLALKGIRNSEPFLVLRRLRISEPFVEFFGDSEILNPS